MIKKVFLIIIFMFFYEKSAIANYKILASVNGTIITELDLENEKKIIKILNMGKDISISKNIALNNLIEEKIKKKEIEKEGMEITDEELDKYLFILIKNLNLDKNSLSKKNIQLIKDKIKINNLWSQLIYKKYFWKISINTDEIEKKNFRSEVN